MKLDFLDTLSSDDLLIVLHEVILILNNESVRKGLPDDFNSEQELGRGLESTQLSFLVRILNAMTEDAGIPLRDIGVDQTASYVRTLSLVAEDRLYEPGNAVASEGRELEREILKDFIVQHLSRVERIIIILYYFEEQTFKNIAAALGLSQRRVAEMHNSVLRRLKAMMKLAKEATATYQSSKATDTPPSALLQKAPIVIETSAASDSSSGVSQRDEMLVLSRLYLEPLLNGDRNTCRKVVDEAHRGGVSADRLLTELIWPTMLRVQLLFRDDSVSTKTFEFATLLNRSIADHVSTKLSSETKNGKRVIVLPGDDEPEELGAQICADIFVATGYSVRFIGGGVAKDDILRLIADSRPDLLLIFASLPGELGMIRSILDHFLTSDCGAALQIMCCDGVYRRVEGISDELGAQLYASSITEALKIAGEQLKGLEPSGRKLPDSPTLFENEGTSAVSSSLAVASAVMSDLVPSQQFGAWDRLSIALGRA